MLSEPEEKMETYDLRQVLQKPEVQELDSSILTLHYVIILLHNEKILAKLLEEGVVLEKELEALKSVNESRQHIATIYAAENPNGNIYY